MRSLLSDVIRFLNPSLSADAHAALLEVWHASYEAALDAGEADQFHADLEALLS